MTGIGKLLVFANLFVSVVLITWATSLYTNRLDWLDRKTADGTAVQGQISVLKKQIDQYLKAAVIANDGYGANAKELAGLEAERLYRRQRYDDLLAQAKKPGENDKRFVTLEYFPNTTVLNVDKAGTVVTYKDRTGAEKPLRGLSELVKDFTAEFDQSGTLRADVAKLREDFKGLSEEIAKVEGQTDAQKVILVSLRKQGEYLGSAQINWDEELRTVTQRKNQLERRLGSLGETVDPQARLGR